MATELGGNSMWTRKGTGSVIFGILITFLSFILENLALLNLGIMLLAFVTMSLFFSGRSLNLKIIRTVDQEKVFEESIVNVTLEIRNQGMAINYLEIFDGVPRELKIIGGTNHAFIRIGAHQVKYLKYTVKANMRGYHYFKKVTLRRYNLFYLNYSVHDYDIPTFLAVFPKVSEISNFSSKTRYPRIFQGAVATRKIGEGANFHSIRNYVPGDPYKKINWKAFGRTQSLMVNEYEREDLLDLMIVVESTKYTAIPNMLDNPIDYSARAAAAIANYFIDRRDNVGMCIYSNKVDYIPQESGSKQFYKMLNALASMYPVGKVSFASVAKIVIRNFTPRSPIILVSSLVGDPDFEKGIRDIISHGFEFICLSPDVSEFLSRVSDIDAHIIQEERKAVISTIQSYGALVIDWDPQTPMETAAMKSTMT